MEEVDCCGRGGWVGGRDFAYLFADGVAEHFVEVGDGVAVQVVELAPEELADEGDGWLGVLLGLGVDCLMR